MDVASLTGRDDLILAKALIYRAKLPKRARLTPLKFLKPIGGGDA